MMSLLLSMVLLAGQAGPPRAPSPSRELQAARHALQIELRPAEAAAILHGLLEREDLPRLLRARVQLELARCDLALGDLPAARRRLQRLDEEPAAVRSRLPGRETLKAELDALSAPVEVSVPEPEEGPREGEPAAQPAGPDPVAAREPVPPRQEPPSQEPPPPEAKPAEKREEGPPTTAPPAEPPAYRSILGTQPDPELPRELRGQSDRIVAADLPRFLGELDRRAELWSESLRTRAEPGRVAGLVGRKFASRLGRDDDAAYLACTYSFEFATRDDRRITYNDWDVQFGNPPDQLHVQMVTDDRSTILNLGPLGPGEARDPAADAAPDRTTARPGQVLLIHTLDSNTDRWFEMQVLELLEGEWILFRWIEVEAP